MTVLYCLIRINQHKTYKGVYNGEKLHFAVVLSGCGRADGSEIHEAVCALLCIENMGCTYQCLHRILTKRRWSII